MVAGAQVPANAELDINFSEAIDPATVNASTVQLFVDGAIAAKTMTISTDEKMITVTPSLTMVEGKTYQLVVDGVKNDAAVAVTKYDVTFTVKSNAVITAAKYYDTSAATETAFPTSDVISSAAITFVATDELRFYANKDLDASTVNTTNVKLKNVTDGTYVAASSVAYDVAGKYVKFVLAGGLTTEKLYQVEFSNVKALDGSSLTNFNYAFNYANPAVTYTKQGVLATATTNVYPSLTGALLEGTYYNGFKAQFTANKELDAATINTNTVVLYEIAEDATESVVESTVALSGGMITLTPNADLVEDSDYKIVFDGVKNTAGVELTDFTQPFSTGDYTAITVTSVEATATSTSNKLTFVFSEAVEDDAAEVVLGNANDFSGNATIIMYNAASNAAVNISGLSKVWNADRTQLELNITTVVTPGTTYVVKIAGANSGTGYLRSNTGVIKKLAADYTKTFVVNADTTAPTVSTVKGEFTDSPTAGNYVITNNKTNVAINKDITVTFADKDLTTIADTTFSATTAVQVYDVTAGLLLSVKLKAPPSGILF